MSDSGQFAYLFFFVIGALITGIHAYDLYRERTSPQEHYFSDLLATTNIAALGGQSAFARGFLAYLAINELIYLILATSTTILDYARKLAVPEQTAGAMMVNDSLASPNILLPIAAATFLTTAARVKPFSEIESLLRRAAHFCAGIPATTYRIADAIASFDFGAIVATGQSSPVVAFSRRRADQTRSQALRQGMDELDAENLSDVVLRVYLFWGWASGVHGERCWTRQSRDLLKPQFDALLPRFDAFESRLKALLDGPAGPEAAPQPNLRQWEEQLDTGQKLRSDCLALLTLLLINNPTFRPAEAESTLSRMVTDIQRGSERLEFNAIAGAVVLGIVGCFFFTFIGYGVADLIRELRGNTSLVQWVANLLTGHVESGPELGDILWHAANYTVMLGGASIIALSLRAARLGNGTWKRWDDRTHHYPILGYMRVTVLSALCIIPAYVLMNFFHGVILPSLAGGFAENFASLWADFAPQLPGLFLDAGFGAGAAWIVCQITDQGRTLLSKGLAISLAIAGVLSLLLEFASSALDERMDAIGVAPARLAADTLWSLVELIFDRFLALSIPAFMMLIFCGLYAALYRKMDARNALHV